MSVACIVSSSSSVEGMVSVVYVNKTLYSHSACILPGVCTKELSPKHENLFTRMTLSFSLHESKNISKKRKIGDKIKGAVTHSQSSMQLSSNNFLFCNVFF